MIERPYFAVCLVDGEIARVTDDLLGWMRGYERAEVPLDLPAQKPVQGGIEATIFWSPATSPGTTAMLYESPFFLVNTAERFRYRCLAVQSSADDEEWPINSMAYYAGGEARRYVGLLRDEAQWEFTQSGEPLPFENLDRYARRSPSDRLDRELLLYYVKCLGWDLAEPSFWTSVAPAVTLRERPDWHAVTPCPQCGQPLRTPRAKQCLRCGADWHDR